MNSKLLKLNILLILLVFVSFVGCSDAEENKREPWAPYTDDMTPKDYYLKDERSGKTWHFRIPKSYLPSKQIQIKYQDKKAELHTGLPELEPRKSIFRIHSKLGTVEHEKELEKVKNGLFILLGGTCEMINL